MDSRARELVRIGDGLFSKKLQWDQLCQRIAELFYPMRADFTSPFVLGEDFSENLMDSYPLQCRETLGNAPSSMLRQGDWFSVQTGLEEIDENPENARWLEYATGHFRRLIYDRRANFVRATGEADHDYVTFGNAVMSVEESPQRDHFLFRDWHPAMCAWMENSVGRVDHLQRRMPMTARNVVKLWPKTVHVETKNKLTNDPTAKCDIRHIVLPVDEIYGDDKAKRRAYRNLPFVSLYVDKDNEIILGEGPLPVFSYVIPRWRTVSSFPQGFSPATINSLPDSRMIQDLSRIILEQGEKAIDAPMFAKGEIFRDSINRYAGGMTYVDLEDDQDIRNAIYTEDASQGLGFGLEMKQDVRNLIAEAFLLNKLMLPSAREMTAFETQARLDEFRRAALPFFGPIESEYHLPLLDTAFQMAVRNDAFDIKSMPKALSDADVTFTFESPLNTAQGRQHVQAFQESIQILAASAEFDKSIPATMDIKKMTKDAVKGTRAPADWFNDEETEQDEEAAIKQAEGLKSMAATLREGAAVGTEVAGATQALQQAGMV